MKKKNTALAIALVAILYLLCCSPFGEDTSTQITVNAALLLVVIPAWVACFYATNKEWIER